MSPDLLRCVDVLPTLALRRAGRSRGPLRREFGWPLTELGTIRLRRGDLAGARTAFLDAHRAGWDPQPGLALLCLQEGDASIVDLVEGHLGDARRAHQRALDLYSELTMPYEAAWARIGLAHTNRAEGVSELPTLEIEAAEEILRGIGAAAPQPAADRVGPGREADPHERVTSVGGSRASVGRMLLEGDHISLSFGDRTVRLRDLEGLRYPARLLAEPDREFHALDLVTAEEGTSAAQPRAPEPDLAATEGGLGPALDDRAKAAYRRRLRDIDEDIEEARSMGDEERAARAEVEREFLVRELSRAVGLGGRDRPTGATAERARVSVTRAVRYALRRVDEHHPELGAHLDHAVRTGTYLAYEPDPRSMVRWTVPDR